MSSDLWAIHHFHTIETNYEARAFRAACPGPSSPQAWWQTNPSPPSGLWGQGAGRSPSSVLPVLTGTCRARLPGPPGEHGFLKGTQKGSHIFILAVASRNLICERSLKNKSTAPIQKGVQPPFQHGRGNNGNPHLDDRSQDRTANAPRTWMPRARAASPTVSPRETRGAAGLAGKAHPMRTAMVPNVGVNYQQLLTSPKQTEGDTMTLGSHPVPTSNLDLINPLDTTPICWGHTGQRDTRQATPQGMQPARLGLWGKQPRFLKK